MTRLIFMLEEPSMATFLRDWLPRAFAGLDFLCIPHEGKRDLTASLMRKLRNWRTPDDRFVVVHDNDGGDCRYLKSQLKQICVQAGRSDTLIRIVCQEMEAWYFGEPAAMAAAFEAPTLAGIGARARFRNPDAIAKPSKELERLHSSFQKIDGARRMAQHLSYGACRSSSFKVLVEGIANLSRLPLPN